MRTRRVLKSWVKNTLIVIGSIVALITLVTINNNLEQGFVENCESMGYSTNYCIAHS